MKAGDDIPPVSLIWLLWGQFGWLIWMGLGLGLALNLFSISQYWTANRLDASGIVVSARIVDRERVEETGADGETTVSYYLTFQFDHRGQRIRERKGVGRSQYTVSPIGRHSDVRFLPRRPRGFEVYIGATRDTAQGFQLGALAFAAVGLGFGYWRGHSSVQTVRARRLGRAEQTTVTEIRRTSVRVNYTRQYRLCWKTESGQTGESWMRSQSGFDQFPVGARIVDFTLGKLSAWRGDIGAACTRHDRANDAAGLNLSHAGRVCRPPG